MGKLSFALLLFLLSYGVAALGQQDQSSSIAAAQGSQTPEPKNSTPAPAPPSIAESKAESTKLDLTPDANGALSQEQMQQLFRIVADKDIENDKRQRDYTYTERDEERKLDGKGKVKSTESQTFDVMEIYGKQVQRKIAKNDQPISSKDAAKEEEKIQKVIEKRKNESDSDRKKREQQEEKDREEGRKWEHEIADAFNFRLVGSEALDGRDNWVIEAEPRRGFQPHLKYANYLPDFHGRVWIDKQDLQLTKMDVECINTASWGLFVARIHKGSRFIIEQTRVNDEVWLPKHVAIKLDVRVALLKNFNMEEDDTYHDYKKFRTSAKIVSVGEIPHQ